jgi:peptidoglycan/LPS O-acetylase OafA/YrhL
MTLVLALGIGAIVAYVVHHSETGPWWRKGGYLLGLSLLAGAVLTTCSGGR